MGGGRYPRFARLDPPGTPFFKEPQSVWFARKLKATRKNESLAKGSTQSLNRNDDKQINT